MTATVMKMEREEQKVDKREMKMKMSKSSRGLEFNWRMP